MMEASICSSICSQEENVNLYFVELVEDSPSNILLCAHQACEKFSRRWLSVEDCKQVTPTKEDIFICDPFEGEAFEYLVSCPNSIVVGPRCILSCLHRMEPIPVLPSPLHNTAMSGVVITTTGFPKAQKEELQQLVQRMSGIYSNNYHQDVTHLVVKMVGSKKYKVAVEQGIPTMTEEWVRAVWKAVVTGDVSDHVSATDNRFLVPYLCQPLHGLVLCVSQTEPSIKMTLKKLIEENGGTYTTNLTREETSVLIVSSPVGKKYRYATKWGVPCVFPDWLHNSVQQGHALDKEEYEVLPRKSSTLNSIHSNDMPPDLSMCSTILNDTEAHRTITSVDETVGLEESVVKERASVEENIEDVEALENLDLQEAMKAGSFLKGYRVFLAGFNPIHMEKLRRVLGAVGASRLSQLTESATHVVLAVPSEEHLRIMRGWNIKPHVVSVRWITESVHLKHPAEESHFTFPVQANREVQLSQTSTQRSFISNTALDNDETYVDEKLLEEHFLQPKRRKSSGRESDQDLSMLPESQVSELPGIFNGKTFTVFGHCQETIEELEEMIELHGGHVVQMESSEVIHYSVVTTRALRHQNKGQLISRAFLEDCIETKRLLAVEYYHLPLLLPSNSFPLDDCCITISTYANKERLFLEHMAILLGAQHQEKFSKMSKPGMNILANTHLLCPTPIGAKYNAARKWAIPAVTCDWLIECARSGQKVSEKTFLVDCSNNNTVQLPRKAIIMELWDSALREGEKMQEMGEEQEDVVPPTPTVAKIKSVRSTEIKSAEVLASSPDRPFDWEAISRMYPTPGTTRFYQAKLDAELDAMPIPNTPYGVTWYSDPPPKIKKCIKKLIDSLPDPSLELANSPTKSPTEELFCEFFVNVSEELLVLTKKIKEKEEKGDHSEEERDSHLSISQDTDLEVKCPTKDLSMHEEFNEKEQENVVKVRADERLSHQLEENAHTTLVERSGGITGRSKVPLAELQRPTTSSKMHHIDVKSQPNEEVENLAIETAWNDPEEHKFRLRLQDHMQDTQDFSAPINKEDEAKPTIDDSNKENISSAPQQGKLPPPPYKEKNKARSNIITSTEIPNQRVFVLVGMSTEEVEDYEEMVVHLGGTVSPSQTVEACVTHVIAKVLSRSERTLMSIVSGMWLLMTSYLDHSLKAGHFLKEEPFAWGNQSSNHHPMLEPESIQDKLAKAAWRWKCAICRVDDGQDKQHWQKQQPFQNMTALIHSQKAKSLSRIIEAGGGQVVSARPPYSEVEGVTHFFVEMEKPHEKIDLASFASRDIPCLEPLFIKSVIMEDTTEISDFYIPAYKEILINMSSCIPSPLKRALRN